MANRFMSQAEVEGATIWYSPSTRRWWMDSTDAEKAARKVMLYPDAIHVANAYEALSEDFIHKLICEAER